MAPPPANCGFSLPCNQNSTSDPTRGSVLEITCTDNGDAIKANCPNSFGAAIYGTSTNDFGTARGIGVLGTVQLGQGGQFNSAGGIGVTANAGLPVGGDPRIQGIGVQASGDSMGVLATSPVRLPTPPLPGGGVGVQAIGGGVGAAYGAGVAAEGVGGFGIGVDAFSPDYASKPIPTRQVLFSHLVLLLVSFLVTLPLPGIYLNPWGDSKSITPQTRLTNIWCIRSSNPPT